MEKTMKDLIWEALTAAAEKLEIQIPIFKDVSKNQEVGGLTLLEAMQNYPEIPANATLETDENDHIVLSWNVAIKTTEEDVLKFKKRRWPNVSWNYVYKILTSNGYNRTGFWSSELKQFDGICAYDKYLAGDADFFVKYYSFRFVKNQK